MAKHIAPTPVLKVQAAIDFFTGAFSKQKSF